MEEYPPLDMKPFVECFFLDEKPDIKPFHLAEGVSTSNSGEDYQVNCFVPEEHSGKMILLPVSKLEAKSVSMFDPFNVVQDVQTYSSPLGGEKQCNLSWRDTAEACSSNYHYSGMQEDNTELDSLNLIDFLAYPPQLTSSETIGQIDDETSTKTGEKIPSDYQDETNVVCVSDGTGVSGIKGTRLVDQEKGWKGHLQCLWCPYVSLQDIYQKSNKNPLCHSKDIERNHQRSLCRACPWHQDMAMENDGLENSRQASGKLSGYKNGQSREASEKSPDCTLLLPLKKCVSVEICDSSQCEAEEIRRSHLDKIELADQGQNFIVNNPSKESVWVKIVDCSKSQAEEIRISADLSNVEPVEQKQDCVVRLPLVSNVSAEDVRGSEDSPDDSVVKTSAYQSLMDRETGVEVCERGSRLSCDFMCHRRIHKVEKLMRCDLCDSRFKHISNLDKHMRIHFRKQADKYLKNDKHKSHGDDSMRLVSSHRDKIPFKCHDCNREFRTKHALILHIRIHTGEKPFDCDICGKSFRQISNMTTHKKRIHSSLGNNSTDCMSSYEDKIPFKQHACNCEFKRKPTLIKDLRIRSGEKPQRCDMRGKRFRQTIAVTAYKKTHLSHTHSDDFCNEDFQEFNHLSLDMKAHTIKKTFQYRYDKGFTQDKICHTSQKPFKCDMCNRNFRWLSYLSLHMNTHAEEKPFKCNVCGKSFTQEGTMVIHKKRHTGKMPFKCDMCNRNFWWLSYLSLHMNTHAEEKPFKCNVCGKSFTQEGTMVIHKKRHTGKMPFKCDMCNRNFRWLSYLSLHMNTHAEEKPFKCNVCGKSFTQEGTMVIHKKRHTGKMSFKCDTCNRNFRWLRHLSRHMNTHVEDKTFKCNVCGKGFTQKFGMVIHKKKAHWRDVL